MKRLLLLAACATLAFPLGLPAHATNWSDVGEVPYGNGVLCARFASIEQTISNCELLLKTGHHFTKEKIPAVLDELASYYGDINQFDSAILLEEKAQQIDSINPEYYSTSIAYYDARQGKFAQAVSYLDGAIAKYGPKPVLLASRCWQRAVQGEQLALAKEDCDTAVATDKGGMYFQGSRCLVNFKLTDYKGAIKDCDVALAHYPRDEGALYTRGVAKLKSSDAIGGNADIAAAKAINPHVADIYAGYGVTP